MENNEKGSDINIGEELKKRFNESFMDIYVCGKYNRLMDVLIGKKEFESFNKLDIDEKKLNDKKEERELLKNNKNNEKKETLLIEFKDEQRNNNLYEKEIDISEF